LNGERERFGPKEPPGARSGNSKPFPEEMLEERITSEKENSHTLTYKKDK